MRILEFKHIAPFDGCFHEWQYIGVSNDGIDPITLRGGNLRAYEIVDLAEGKHIDRPSWELGFHKDFTWYDWPENPDDELMRMLSYNWYPAFWRFALEHGLEFPWQCYECGRLVGLDEPPTEMAGYRGNGGVGIRVEGWICTECANAPKEVKITLWESDGDEELLHEFTVTVDPFDDRDIALTEAVILWCSDNGIAYDGTVWEEN